MCPTMENVLDAQKLMDKNSELVKYSCITILLKGILMLLDLALIHFVLQGIQRTPKDIWGTLLITQLLFLVHSMYLCMALNPHGNPTLTLPFKERT